MLKMLYKNNYYDIIDESELENNINDIVNDKCMVFINEDIFNAMSDEVKESLNVSSDDYTVEEMLDMDVLIVTIDNEFDKEKFINLVEQVKKSKHEFAEIVIV